MGTIVRINSISDFDYTSIIEMPEKLAIFHFGEFYPDDYPNLDEDTINELNSWIPDSIRKVYDVEGASQWISYLLTGEHQWNEGIKPLNFLNAKNKIIQDIIGYGAHFYDLKETELLFSQLNQVDLDAAVANFDPNDFISKQICPRNYKWSESDRLSLKPKLIEVKSFIHQLVLEKLGFYVSWE